MYLEGLFKDFLNILKIYLDIYFIIVASKSTSENTTAPQDPPSLRDPLSHKSIGNFLLGSSVIVSKI
jgi:hypothetical protein